MLRQRGLLGKLGQFTYWIPVNQQVYSVTVENQGIGRGHHLLDLYLVGTSEIDGVFKIW